MSLTYIWLGCNLFCIIGIGFRTLIPESNRFGSIFLSLVIVIGRDFWTYPWTMLARILLFCIIRDLIPVMLQIAPECSSTYLIHFDMDTTYFSVIGIGFWTLIPDLNQLRYSCFTQWWIIKDIYANLTYFSDTISLADVYRSSRLYVQIWHK